MDDRESALSKIPALQLRGRGRDLAPILAGSFPANPNLRPSSKKVTGSPSFKHHRRNAFNTLAEGVAFLLDFPRASVALYT